MTNKDYSEVLKFAIRAQIAYVESELVHDLPYERERYLEGVISGLDIALEKIEASMFLVER